MNSVVRTRAERKRIYSLGTSTRSMDEFISLLRTYGVQAVVDVRSFPTSRFDHFRKDMFEKGLRENGFSYHYLGNELGGYRRGGYEKYRFTSSYVEGVSKLEEIGNTLVGAFVCAERLPWKCHRRWIGDSLMRKGWEVIHIIDGERTWKPGKLR